MHRLFALAAITAVVLPLPALAIPGQSSAAFLKWMRANSALSHIHTVRNEMSGGTVYQADFKAGSNAGTFSGEPAGGVIPNETLALPGMPESYDLRKHRDVAESMLRRIYGSAIGVDFANAKLAGDFSIYHTPMRTAFYRGSKFAYQLTGVRLDVLRLSQLPELLKSAKQCESMECGD